MLGSRRTALQFRFVAVNICSASDYPWRTFVCRLSGKLCELSRQLRCPVTGVKVRAAACHQVTMTTGTAFPQTTSPQVTTSHTKMGSPMTRYLQTRTLVVALTLLSFLSSAAPAQACLWWLMPGFYGMQGWAGPCAPGGYAVPSAVPYYAGYAFGPRLMTPVWGNNACCVPQACNPCQSACGAQGSNGADSSTLKPQIDDKFAAPATGGDAVDIPYDDTAGSRLPAVGDPAAPADSGGAATFDDLPPSTFAPGSSDPAFDAADFPPIDDQTSTSNKPPVPELLEESSAETAPPEASANEDNSEVKAPEPATPQSSRVPVTRSQLSEVLPPGRLPRGRDDRLNVVDSSVPVTPVRWISVPLPANQRRL